MKSIQYTIRNVPPKVDRYYRKLSKLSGKSLNQVILEDLADKSGAKKSKDGFIGSIDWFIGANTIDEASYRAWEEDDKIQKELTRKQWLEDDN